MRWSLRFQLLAPLAIMLLGVAAITVWAAVSSANHAREQIDNQVKDIALTLNGSSYRLTEHILQLLKGLTGADYLLIEKSGKRVSTLQQLPAGLSPPKQVENQVVDTFYLDEHLTIKDTGYLYAGMRLTRGRNEGSAVYIFYPESRWRDAMWQAVRPSLIAGALGSAAAIVFTVVLSHQLTRRVRELERQTRLIAKGDFNPMPLPKRNDELRDLAKSVNQMAERLAEFQESMTKNERMRLLGQVSGGLAHQLRNGVTGAKLAVQVHARETKENDQESLQVALRQLSLVEMHLKRFLELGNGKVNERKRCSLSQILQENIELLLPQCRHAHVELQIARSDDDILLEGNQDQLEQLFLNLIVNAIEAAGNGGKVNVELAKTHENAVQFRVSDSGPGPKQELADRLFEPFVTGKSDGIGLGLAVAKEAALSHGGKIWCERIDGETRFVVELPLGTNK